MVNGARMINYSQVYRAYKYNKQAVTIFIFLSFLPDLYLSYLIYYLFSSFIPSHLPFLLSPYTLLPLGYQISKAIFLRIKFQTTAVVTAEISRQLNRTKQKIIKGHEKICRCNLTNN